MSAQLNLFVNTGSGSRDVAKCKRTWNEIGHYLGGHAVKPPNKGIVFSFTYLERVIGTQDKTITMDQMKTDHSLLVDDSATGIHWQMVPSTGLWC